jgi:ABC-type sugar transport system ATPase subunit
LTAAPILRAERVHRRFGGVHALRGAELTVYPGEVHALVGENGSGKSTLLRILSGQLQPDGGELFLAGRDGPFRSASEALQSGVVTVSQETTLVPDLSIAENIFLGHRMPRRAGVVDWRATRREAAAALGRLGLALDPARTVRHLRPDQAQMVEIVRALSLDARVLILDEPTSSLTDDEVEALFAAVRRLRDDGAAVVFVSHRLHEVFALADRITVLRDGRTVGSAPAAELDRQSLIALMVGGALEDVDAAAHEADGEDVVLRVRGLSRTGAFAGVDLTVARGEIVGLAGLVGAGRTELLESVFALNRAEGEIEIGGRRASYRRPADAIRDGVALVPADRTRHGLVLGRSVHENLLMAVGARGMRLRRPSPRREAALVGAAVDQLQIRAHSPRVAVSTLSGGNQQKVLLGKWLETKPRLLMLDEPTRGVDVGAKAEIYRLLFEARAQGIGVLVSSSEIPELLTLCDRIVVMFRGRVAASLGREQASEALIAHYAGGGV